MTLMRTCSLMVKGPGLSEAPKILTLGITRCHRRMIGKVRSRGTRGPMVTEG